MRKAIIIGTIVIAVLLILAAVGPRLIPSSTYKKIIEESLSRRLDATVSMDSFDFRIIPYPGYTIEGFSLVSTRAPFLGMPVLTAKRIVGSLSFSGLLRGRVATGIDVRDAVLTYRSQAGVSNLGLLFKPAPDAAGAFPQGAIKSIGAGGAPATAPKAEPLPGDAPGFRALPAPHIEPPTEDSGGASGTPETKGPSSFLMDRLLIREACADDGADRAGPMSIEVKDVEVTRGRVVVDSDELAQPLAIEGVSMAARNIEARGGISADISFSGTVGGAGRRNLSLRGRLALDDSRRELKATGVSAYFMGSQFAADVATGLGLTPPSLDFHIASPDLNPEAAGQLFSLLGWPMPESISWQGTLGADVSYKGTSERGELALRLDARAARLSVGRTFKKEAGSPFKLAADIVMTEEALLIGKGTLSIGFDELDLAGEIRRDSGLTTRLRLMGGSLDATALRALLPSITGVVELFNAGAEMSMQGELMAPAPMRVSGKVEADRAVTAGLVLTNLAASFERSGDGISVTAVRGDIDGGGMSGNGSVMAGAVPSVEIDAVAHGVDASGVSSVRGVVEGSAEIVFGMKASGSDQYAMENSLSMSGTFVMDDFQGLAASTVRDLLSDATTMTAVADAAGLTLKPASLTDIAKSEPAGSQMRVTFEMIGRDLAGQDVTWKGDGYSVHLQFGSAPSGALEGDGEVELDSGMVKGLFSSGATPSAALDKDGRLILPVSLSGNLARPQMKFDSARFSKLMEERKRFKAKIGEIEKAEDTDEGKDKEKDKKAAAGPKPKPKRPRRATSKPKPRREPARPSITSPMDQEVDDILKVIVGD